MAMLGCVSDNDLIMKLVSSEMSNATARTIYNKNFEQLTKAFKCIRDISLGDLNDVLPPSPPITNVNYVFMWNGTSYELVSANTSPGTKFIIAAGELIFVSFDRQYIVKDHLYLYGDLEVEGELVIL
jgi:hypothetical protein